jgi:hypothetical protein
VVLRLLIDTFTALEAQIKELDGEINRRSRAVPQPDLIADAVGVASSASNSAFASLTSGAPKPSANQP